MCNVTPLPFFTLNSRKHLNHWVLINDKKHNHNLAFYHNKCPRRRSEFKFKFKFKIFFTASYYINGQEIWTYDTCNQDSFSGALRRMADLITLCKALVLCWISTVRAHSQSGNPSQLDFLKCILFICQWHNAAQVCLTQNVNNNRSKGSGKPDKVYGLL